MFSKKFILILFLALFTIYFSGCGSDQQEKIQESLGNATKDSAGVVTVAAITPDDVINSTEAGETIIVSGIASGGAISSGDAVVLLINGTEYYSVVAKDGSWNTQVSGSDLASDTEFTVKVQSMDSSSNPVVTTAVSKHTVDMSATSGIITIAPITPDNIINAREATENILVHGIAIDSDISSGDYIEFTTNNVDYNATIKPNGGWSVKVAGQDLVVSTELTVNVITATAVIDNNITGRSNAPKRPVSKSRKTKYVVDTTATAGTVTVAPITEDDIINGLESTQAIVVSGVALGGDISAGDIAVFIVNQTTYTAVIAADGSWKTGVAGSDLAADTEFTVNVESTDIAGNVVVSSTVSTHTVDTTADSGTVTVSPITADDVINSKEYMELITITGIAAGGDISNGDTVSFNVNGTNYTSTVSTNGSWSVNVVGSDLAAQTEIIVNVTSYDTSLNKVVSSAISTHSVDLTADAGTVTVATITADNVINSSEATQTILVSGTAIGGNISAGDAVTFSVNGTNYSSTVGADGSWSVNVAGSDLAVQTEFTVKVTSTDSVGNTINSTTISTHTVNMTADAGTVTVAPITADDLINSSEAAQTIIVSGTATGGDIAAGDAVTFNVNGTDYASTVGSDGSWSTNVAGSDLAIQTEFTVRVISRDSVGNTVTSTTTSTHTVDVKADAGTVTVAPITADDLINSSEATQTVLVSGTATGGDISTGDAVTFSVNGINYASTVGVDGSWSVNVAGSDLALDTGFIVNVASKNLSGAAVTSTATSTHTVDMTADAGTVTVAPITADDVINNSESTQTVLVSGTATGGDISTGDAVTFSVNGINYTSTVGVDGSWSVNVAGSDLALDTEFIVNVASTDAYSNPVTSTATSTHMVVLKAEKGAITVDPITSDNIINATESAQTILVSGTVVGGDISIGDNVNFTINKNNYTAQVQSDWTWKTNVSGADLAATTQLLAWISYTDVYGNVRSSSITTTYIVDLSSAAGIVTVTPITADDVINNSESTQTIIVSGTAIGGDITAGDAVTFSVNGTNYSSTVGADGSWSANVAGSDLALDTEFIVNVASTDAYSNPVTSTATSTHMVVLKAEKGAITVDPITSDNIINATESAQAILVSGTVVGGDISIGDNVNFTINKNNYTAQVQSDWTWKTGVSGADLAAATQFLAWISYTDVYGNTRSSSVTANYIVDLSINAGTVTVAPITADNIINSTEAAQTILVSGTATGGDITAGDAVTFSVNGTNYSSTVGADGSWSVNVAGSDLAAQTQFTVTVTSKDSASNIITSTTVSTHSVDTLNDDRSTVVAKLSSEVIDSTLANNTTYTGIVVNASVAQGVEYTCNNQKFTTSQYGTLNCDIFPISFNLGNLELGSISKIDSDFMIYMQDIFGLPRGGTMHPVVTNISILLQSLDDDADLSTGINISTESINLINTYFPVPVQFSTVPYAELLYALESIITDRALQTNPVQLSLVPMADAQDNLTKRMASPFTIQ